LIDSQLVTLWASDVTSSDSSEAMFYTDNGGIDRLGSVTDTSTIVYDPDFSVSDGGFTVNPTVYGTVTISNVGDAICLDVPAAGDNMGNWYGPMSIPLTANTVYIVRARVNGTQASAGTVPFWDMIIDNYAAVGTYPGLNLFGGDMMILDNEGGANACFNKPSTNGTIITWIWAPAAMLTTAWNNATTGPFATAVGANRDFRFQFRVMDLDSAGLSTTGNLDSGRLCMNKLEIRAVPYSAFTFTNEFSQTSLSSSNMTVVSYGPTTGSWGSGICTLSAPGTTDDYTMVRPGDNVYDLGIPTSIPDNMPVVWESNAVYQAVFEMSAPTTTDENNPFDVYWIGLDTVTNELISTSFITANQNLSGMPKSGPPQEFVAFMHGNNTTLSSGTNFGRLRSRLDIGALSTLNWAPNTGQVRIHSIKTNKATMPSIPALP